mmetsp:Transcript_70554/g.183062  ORF Transcript_70554/g.183062 Transcript_70554/m.183062 type:complete len:201 (+) Transcript_70554:4485-5087(+)
MASALSWKLSSHLSADSCNSLLSDSNLASSSTLSCIEVSQRSREVSRSAFSVLCFLCSSCKAWCTTSRASCSCCNRRRSDCSSSNSAFNVAAFAAPSWAIASRSCNSSVVPSNVAMVSALSCKRLSHLSTDSFNSLFKASNLASSSALACIALSYWRKDASRSACSSSKPRWAMSMASCACCKRNFSNCSCSNSECNMAN